MTTFDPLSTLQSIRKEILAKRKRRYFRSRLDRYAHELALLYEAGANPTEMQTWLKKQHLKVSLSTVTRWLDKNEIRPCQIRNTSR